MLARKQKGEYLMKKSQIALTLGIVCVFITLGITVQINTITSTTNPVSSNATVNKLRDEVFKWEDRYEQIHDELQKAEEELEEERKKATEKNSEAAELEHELTTARMLLGLTEVKGKGVIITLEDNLKVMNNLTALIIDPNQLLVHDGDLINIVNILKNAGAEAISINDQRVVSTTAITCDGYVVRINGEKVGAPFTIKAIGSPEYLKGSLDVSGYMEQMKEDGVIVDIKKSSNSGSITIPKYEGLLTHEYIKER